MGELSRRRQVAAKHVYLICAFVQYKASHLHANSHATEPPLSVSLCYCWALGWSFLPFPRPSPHRSMGRRRAAVALASCSFSLTDGNGGTGTAYTSAYVPGYVGQSPLYFSGGYVSFKLPGESTTTYASGVYSGVAVLAGYSSTAGTLYRMNGSFSATDANSGTVVTGTTNTVVGIKGHSGRGGGEHIHRRQR